MPAIETAVEVSECEITPAAFGSDTPIPWVNIEISHEHAVVHLSFATADDVSRLMTACERSLGFFVRNAPESDVPACETEIVR